MNKIYILFLILTLALNAQSVCTLKGGIINEKDDKPYFVIQHKDNSQQLFSYNDMHKKDCIKNINMLYDDTNTMFKDNRLYLISFSIEPSDEGKILSIEEELKIEVKVRNKNGNTNVKVAFRSEMKIDHHFYSLSNEISDETREFNYYSEYITHIESLFGTTQVLNMYTSPNLSRNLRLDFNLNKNFNNKNIKFVLTNNKDLKRTFLKNEQKYESNVIQTNKKIEAVFNAKTQSKAIEKMYGVINDFKEGNITIKSHDVASGDWAVPLRIISDINAESILVLTDGTWYPVITAIISTPYNKINYFLSLNLGYKNVSEYEITVIIKDNKGNYYKAEKKSAVVHYVE